MVFDHYFEKDPYLLKCEQILLRKPILESYFFLIHRNTYLQKKNVHGDS